MSRYLCVFASSSSSLGKAYVAAAERLGDAMTRRGWSLVYGGAGIGLMGAAGIAYGSADELILTRDLRERKALMQERADAFVALPGGFGTLEEVFEMLTLKQLGDHAKPLILLNVDGFFDPLLDLCEHVYAQGMAPSGNRALYQAVDHVETLLDALDAYEPPQVASMWA